MYFRCGRHCLFINHWRVIWCRQ